MTTYSNEQLATVVALPTVTVLLIWTVVIFHKNRKNWGPYDIPIVCVLVLSIIRNALILAYLLIATLTEGIEVDYCSVVVWVFNSIHTFQASSLATIAVIGLFSVKLHRKQQNLRVFLTPTHVIYHLFCLTTLCACVGVAAILAQDEDEGIFESLSGIIHVNPCRFMPFDLDVKYNIFILILHLFLAGVAFVSFLIICYTFYKDKRQGFDYLKKSNSDLSDMSVGASNTFNVNVAENSNKHLYDTYTVHRSHQGSEVSFYDQNHHPNPQYQSGFCAARDVNWNSDFSNISATVSSTNSRRPCLARNLQQKDTEDYRTGLETMHPVLIVCYLFYHLPLIVLCIYPKLIYPWSVAGMALWLGLVQDLLIPVGLGIVDSRFCKWVSAVYKCSGKNVEEKLPHVGLDGKFRPFCTTSQPQSLDISSGDRTMRSLQAIEHRFPITNGSLYTSIDGRLPVIHNYRRHKDQRGAVQQPEKQSSNVALHSSHLLRQDFSDGVHKVSPCGNCEADLCPSHLSPHYINKQLSLLQQTHSVILSKDGNPIRVCHSQESLNYQPEVQGKHYLYRNGDVAASNSANNHIMKNSRNLVRLNKMRLSRSEDSLTDLQVRELESNLPRSAAHKSLQLELQPQNNRTKNFHTKVEVSIRNSYSSSDDDYLTDANDTANTNTNENFDSLSCKSCYSITTEANCDFEFFQSNDHLSTEITIENGHRDCYVLHGNGAPVCKHSDPVSSKNGSASDLSRNFRITRSNSKRSLENFQAFIQIENGDTQNVTVKNTSKTPLQRSNSYTTLEDRKKRRKHEKFPNASQCAAHKNKSVEYLPGSNSSTIFVDDVSRTGDFFVTGSEFQPQKYIGSVPDFKKVFISEYI